MSLEERYEDAPEFLELYRRICLSRDGLAELDSGELAFIKSKLRRSASLRRR